MVLCVKTPLKKAQQVKQFLIEKKLFNQQYSFKRTKSYILFPITKKTGIKKKFSFAELTDVKSLPKARKKKDIKSEVTKKLTKKELDHLRRAYDVIGDIAILEVPPELIKKEKLIAQTLLKLHKNINTVLKKAGIHGTEFRTQPMKHLAGKRTKKTIHKEHGVRLKLDVEKVYFSPRLSTERKRIAQQVKKGERVLVMFSGCAPYPCVLAKNTKAKEIVGIEINPIGHDYGVENLKLNKIKNVTLINSDVRDAVPILKTKFNRIAMPLPKTAEDFLKTAFTAAKKGTIIHFYAFEEQGKFKDAHARIRKACKKNKLKCRILKTTKCGQHAPRTYRICVDFKIL
ncbi:class I SAM-dependent methyltransferase family protein [Candidatus Woesearchaeota archaeon]|jgi:tRNA (guanine37-N1)-methyltransferase|nr:class I SAM-dependent methyltransferase family protein [Candidatus Woesearchaeota archaeon]